MRLLFFFLLFQFASFAQIGTGQWRLHVPSSKALDVASSNNKIYTAYQNGISEYDLESNELSVWDAVNGLSDITVSALAESTSDNSVFIGYENGNLDKIKDNSVTNIPAIVLAEIQGSKKIYNIVEHNSYMYLATGFAIVKIDPAKNEVRDTYYPTSGNDPIVDVAFRGDSIYAITEDRMYRGYLPNPALADPLAWEIDTRLLQISGDKYEDIELLNNELVVLKRNNSYGYDSVMHVVNTGAYSAVSETFATEIVSIDVIGDQLFVNYFAGTSYYDVNFNFVSSLGVYSFGAIPSLNGIISYDGNYWLADQFMGLVRYGSGSEKISFSGPPKNDFYKLDWQRGKLVVAGGSLSQVFVTFNTSGVYYFEDEEWTLKDKSNMDLWQDKSIWDFIAISVNPADKDEVAVGTYSKLPLSIIDATGQVVDTFTEVNSLLEKTSLGNSWTHISDVQYDNQGNLWVLNGYANAPLKVYTKEGDWYEFEMNTNSKNKFTRDLVVDYNGNKWISVKGSGIFGYNDNGTISTTSDDKYVQLNSGDYTGALPSNEVNVMAVDFDNEIWIGTDNGFAVLYNSDNAFDASPGDYNAQRIKLEFEGNVEYMLGATNITDIEVDGGNRKWFGTANSGIILLSADGQEVLEHHTEENSPLISNTILDMELDQNTGELFIVTDKGLVSYRTDASYEDSDYSDVKVFPNPARPEFEGPITIQGIKYDSDVKITDVAGNLVYKTTSAGGTATWDGKTLDGERVKTGVYLIWTAPNEGKKRFVGKVLIVN